MLNIKKTNRVAIIEMVHGKVNAMDIEFCEGMQKALIELEQDPEIAGVVLTSGRKIYSPGIDLKRIVLEPPDYVSQFIPSLEDCLKAMFGFSKPAIAAVNGHAVAGGCAMSLSCDFRIIGSDALIGMPEARLGVPLPPIAVEIMQNASRQAARLMVQSGKTYVGQQAVDAGLADECSPLETIEQKAALAAQEFAEVPSEVFTLTKRQLRDPVFDQVKRSETQFGKQVYELWESESTRRTIEEFVDARLTRSKQETD